MQNYFKATDGQVTIFRATGRVYKFGYISTNTVGFSNVKGAVKEYRYYPAISITKSEYDALQAARVERVKCAGLDPTQHVSPRDSWVLNASIDAPDASSGGFRLTDRKFTTKAYP